MLSRCSLLTAHCQLNKWCERGDSNPHTFRYQILSLARLPIPPLSQFELTRGESEDSIGKQACASDAVSICVRTGSGSDRIQDSTYQGREGANDSRVAR